MTDLILIRGLPGSGKITLARKMAEAMDADHYEADMFFVRSDDQYDFRPEMLKQAHAWCQRMTKIALDHGRDVIVSNTFTQLWEMRPYFAMGADRVTVLTCEGDYGNIHGVPDAAIKRMRARWENYGE
jgi:predicted kinase